MKVPTKNSLKFKNFVKQASTKSALGTHCLLSRLKVQTNTRANKMKQSEDIVERNISTNFGRSYLTLAKNELNWWMIEICPRQQLRRQIELIRKGFIAVNCVYKRFNADFNTLETFRQKSASCQLSTQTPLVGSGNTSGRYLYLDIS